MAARITVSSPFPGAAVGNVCESSFLLCIHHSVLQTPRIPGTEKPSLELQSALLCRSLRRDIQAVVEASPPYSWRARPAQERSSQPWGGVLEATLRSLRCSPVTYTNLWCARLHACVTGANGLLCHPTRGRTYLESHS